MKKYITLAILAVALIGMPALVTTGCKAPTQQKLALNTITSSHQAVDFALDSYLDLVLNKKLATNGVPAVMQSYGVYQSAYNAALTLVLGNTNAPAPPELNKAATSFTDTVTQAKKGAL